MSSKDLHATWRGFVTVFTVTIGVVEAVAWLGLLLFAWGTVVAVLKDRLQMNGVLFYALFAATVIISLRATYEFAAYLRKVGDSYER